MSNGLRGVTLDDVANVGRRRYATVDPRGGGLPTTRATPSPALSVEDFVARLVGQPGPTYGQKYGGYPTLGMLQSAIRGIASAVPQAQRLALEEASARETALLDAARQELLFQPGTAASRQYETLGALDRPLSSAPEVASAQETLSNLLAQRSLYDPARQAIADAGFVSDKPGFYSDELAGRPSAALRDEARLAARNLPAEQQPGNWLERSLAIAQARKDLRDASYAEAMNRRNAVAFAGMEEAEYVNPATGQLEVGMVTPAGGTGIQSRYDVARSQATPQVREQLASQLAEQVDPFRQFASDISARPMSEYMQLIAQQQFGMDPALAAGLFGVGEDIDYMKEQMDLADTQLQFDMAQAGFNPGATTEEIVFSMGGADALDQYQQYKYDSAMEKAMEGPATEQEKLFDIEVANNLGVSVKTAAGDLPESLARQALTDQNFVDYLAMSQKTLQDTEAMTLEDRRNQIRSIGADFYEQTADPLKAQILVNILMSFDFLQANASISF
jgi:hypothetical protein